MNDVAEQPVRSRRQRWRRFRERRLPGAPRVQVGDGVEPRCPHQEQMHQMPVIGDQIVGVAPAQPAGIGQRQVETSGARLRDGDLHRLVNETSIRPCLAVPPASPADDRQRQDRGGHGHRRPAARDAAVVGNGARGQIRLAQAGAHDGDRPRHQQRHQPEQQESQEAWHRAHRARQRRNRHGHHAGAARSIGRHADLPSARLHQPDRAVVVARIVGPRARHVGHRWRAHPRSAQRQRHDRDPRHVVVQRADLDLSDPRDHLRRADRHQQVVGTGLAVLHSVGASHVSLRCGGQRAERHRGSDRDRASHRRSRASQRPAARPAAIESPVPTTAAISQPTVDAPASGMNA